MDFTSSHDRGEVVSKWCSFISFILDVSKKAKRKIELHSILSKQSVVTYVSTATITLEVL